MIMPKDNHIWSAGRASLTWVFIFAILLHHDDQGRDRRSRPRSCGFSLLFDVVNARRRRGQRSHRGWCRRYIALSNIEGNGLASVA
jgi:hypothetical protein